MIERADKYQAAAIITALILASYVVIVVVVLPFFKVNETMLLAAKIAVIPFILLFLYCFKRSKM